ncbi:hypothetical protein CUMW_257930 [Citrus unshiu]|uniref:Uncharacterized protein n=1 Tax=Citrus unshiu TaxID=55188 RepID=A0A2H5QSK6_CITUN|nr:hypothetical protein CUMW_257930 [Citrus unshiu]
MLHESAAFSGVLSHSCPPRRATRSVVLSHKISTPPACWPGESKFSSGQLSTQSSAKNTVESRNARCWCASCPRVKARRREGDAAGEGKRFRRSRYFICFSSKTKKAEDGLRCVLSEGNTLFRPHRGGMIAEASPRSARWAIGIAAFGLCLPFLIRI